MDTPYYERRQITNESVNRAIAYILGHAEEELTLDQVAKHCHFSKFYFSRLFKAQTGESVYGFIKRVKLEQSAFRLKTEERPITEISADFGYSASNYSSAFRLCYHMSPIQFRRGSRQHALKHPFFHREGWKLESLEEYGKRIEIRQMPDYFVIYERRFGSYDRLSQDWTFFLEKYGKYISDDTRFLEMTHQDPAVTEAKRCLSDICMTTEADCPLENTRRIRGGRRAVYHFQGHMKHIYAAYQTLLLVWLPGSPYELDSGRSLFDLYYRVDAGKQYVEMDICLPIKGSWLSLEEGCKDSNL